MSSPDENPYESPRTDIGPRPRLDDLDMATGDWLLAILCSSIGCIMGIIWMIQGKPKGSKMVGISILFSIIWGIVRFAAMSLSER